MENWKTGILGEGNVGQASCLFRLRLIFSKRSFSIKRRFHFSTIPLFHHSISQRDALS